MSQRDVPTMPPPAPTSLAQRLREQATEARLMATAALRSAKDLDEAAARIERGEVK